eukprot:TRINITY_DN1647_c0_g1_i3.p3 TRINITY_DN1647_c0_g1~~TRINITY_DN1647_c0_g1_i3.p3  ORF type:complete len:235 (+),score=14.51 TRINITY_DN1647_c0_g1_i3:966-1670(+)
MRCLPATSYNDISADDQPVYSCVGRDAGSARHHLLTNSRESRWVCRQLGAFGQRSQQHDRLVRRCRADLAILPCQFGRYLQPIHMAGFNPSQDRKVQLTESFEAISDKLKNAAVEGYEIELIGGSSDGASGNLTKRLRNALFNRVLWARLNDVTVEFSIQTLMDHRITAATEFTAGKVTEQVLPDDPDIPNSSNKSEKEEAEDISHYFEAKGIEGNISAKFCPLLLIEWTWNRC